jgi:hypothetical protein
MPEKVTQVPEKVTQVPEKVNQVLDRYLKNRSGTRKVNQGAGMYDR